MNKILTLIIIFLVVTSCTRDGHYESYYDLKKQHLQVEGYYVKNQKHGTWRFWYKDGKPECVETYEYGKLNGLRMYYHENGVLKDSTNYKNDHPIGLSKHWYESGIVSYITEYDSDGHMQGDSKTWYVNGQLHQEGQMKKTRMDGKFIDYYKNGQIEKIHSYKVGTREDEWIYFNENGDTLKKEYYDNGVLIDSIYFNYSNNEK
ncbi:toxin-antitoxin system YwqK family antitoxin [Saccharicrinis sp. FJH62]|uniref:toxin-antitoxin system YwqK family antitoxin n=1 Tax=Saccharicrinis sp. FJH62 TaxID=3344657 RepID=UPI0035D4916B